MISLLWWGKLKSMPPACTSKWFPRWWLAMALHSMCQPGRPTSVNRARRRVVPRALSNGLLHPISFSFDFFQSTKSRGDLTSDQTIYRRVLTSSRWRMHCSHPQSLNRCSADLDSAFLKQRVWTLLNPSKRCRLQCMWNLFVSYGPLWIHTVALYSLDELDNLLYMLCHSSNSIRSSYAEYLHIIWAWTVARMKETYQRTQPQTWALFLLGSEKVRWLVSVSCHRYPSSLANDLEKSQFSWWSQIFNIGWRWTKRLRRVQQDVENSKEPVFSLRRSKYTRTGKLK